MIKTNGTNKRQRLGQIQWGSRVKKKGYDCSVNYPVIKYDEITYYYARTKIDSYNSL